jgi:hypothetical protein
MFKNGRTSLSYAERSGGPSTSTSDEKQEHDKSTILDDRRTTIKDTVTRLGISQGSALTIMHGVLGFHKVRARWVPKFLTEEHKSSRLDISCRLSKRYNNQGENCLIVSLLEARPVSTFTAQKANTRICSESTQHLLRRRN